MYLNQFSVRIPEGQEDGGYVELAHHTVYTVVLKNDRPRRADAWVEIDGHPIGTFRLAPHATCRLERSPQDRGRFTFLALGTPEAVNAGLSGDNPNLGLIRVVFTPEQATPVVPILTEPRHPGTPQVHPRLPIAGDAQGLNVHGRQLAGGTGLSGVSAQSFSAAESIAPDVTQQTTIHLRLVAATSAATVRPLTAFSTPVPPAV